MSAIDWLNDDTLAPRVGPIEPNSATSITLAPIDAAPLAANPTVTIGLLDPSAMGFDDTFWNGFDPSDLPPLPPSTLPTLADLHQRMLLMRAPSSADVALARVQALYDLGRLDAAWTLAQPLADRGTAFFEKALDIALLSDNLQDICQIWYANRGLSTAVETRVLCLSLLGNWQAAANVFVAHDVLGDISASDADLIAMHLEPELIEGESAPTVNRSEMTPFRFAMMESAGFHQPTANLPLPFAYAQLTKDSGWKPHLDAAERLARVASVTPNQLLGVYTQRAPAASGGVWERARAVQRLRAAFASGTTTAQDIQQAWNVLAPAGVAGHIARQFRDQWVTIDALVDDPYLQRFALLAGLGQISSDGSNLSLTVFEDKPVSLRVTGPTRAALIQGLAPSDPAHPTAKAISGILAAGARAAEQDLTALTETLQGWVTIGQPDVAQRVALDYLILADGSPE